MNSDLSTVATLYFMGLLNVGVVGFIVGCSISDNRKSGNSLRPRNIAVLFAFAVCFWLLGILSARIIF